LKQFSPSCERNKEFILTVLKEILPPAGTVLEVGSGSGQHAAYFATHLPALAWQPTDLAENHASIQAWGQEANLPNLRAPLELNLFSQSWPVAAVNAVVCINTIHIVAWQGVENLFANAARVLVPSGVLYAYGPYRYATRALEPSNENFDQWLKARDPVSGVRDFDAVNALAEQNGLTLAGDRAMPANNRSLWWKKIH
jgi:SAM-dependent methyltransferase